MGLLRSFCDISVIITVISAAVASAVGWWFSPWLGTIILTIATLILIAILSGIHAADVERKAWDTWANTNGVSLVPCEELPIRNRGVSLPDFKVETAERGTLGTGRRGWIGLVSCCGKKYSAIIVETNVQNAAEFTFRGDISGPESIGFLLDELYSGVGTSSGPVLVFRNDRVTPTEAYATSLSQALATRADCLVQYSDGLLIVFCPWMRGDRPNLIKFADSLANALEQGAQAQSKAFHGELNPLPGSLEVDAVRYWDFLSDYGRHRLQSLRRIETESEALISAIGGILSQRFKETRAPGATVGGAYYKYYHFPFWMIRLGVETTRDWRILCGARFASETYPARKSEASRRRWTRPRLTGDEEFDWNYPVYFGVELQQDSEEILRSLFTTQFKNLLSNRKHGTLWELRGQLLAIRGPYRGKISQELGEGIALHLIKAMQQFR